MDGDDLELDKIWPPPTLAPVAVEVSRSELGPTAFTFHPIKSILSSDNRTHEALTALPLWIFGSGLPEVSSIHTSRVCNYARISLFDAAVCFLENARGLTWEQKNARLYACCNCSKSSLEKGLLSHLTTLWFMPVKSVLSQSLSKA